MGSTRIDDFVHARDGVAIHFVAHHHPDAEGLPVMVVPGFGESAEEYEDLLLALSPRDAVAVSVRGRGRSDVPEAGYRFEEHIDDVEAVLATMLWSRVVMVGFSRGSSYALGYALRHPERVAGLVIGDYEARHVGLPPSFVDASMARNWRGLSMAERMPEHAIRGMQSESVEIPLWDQLASLQGPVLLVRPGPGRRGLITDATVERYRQALADVQVAQLGELAGHDLWDGDPEGMTAVLRDFLHHVDHFPPKVEP